MADLGEIDDVRVSLKKKKKKKKKVKKVAPDDESYKCDEEILKIIEDYQNQDPDSDKEEQPNLENQNISPEIGQNEKEDLDKTTNNFNFTQNEI